MKIIIIRNCGIEGTFKVKRMKEGCYVIEHNGIDCLVNPSWCEVVEEDKQCGNCNEYKSCYDEGMKCTNLELWKPIENKKNCNNCYWNSEKEENRYIETTVKKCIDNNYKWWEKIEETNNLKTTKKDIELPNEFYFKYRYDDINFKAILNSKNMYRIYSSLNNEYYCSYAIDGVKHNIETKEWIIVDEQKNIELNKDNIVKGKDQKKGYIKNIEDVQKLKNNNGFKIEFDNFSNFNSFKKSNKFIKVNTILGFEVYIIKDKIISFTKYEEQTHICTLDVAGDYIVTESVEDIIKMLEE